MSFDELLGLLFTLYIMGSVLSAILRRGGRSAGGGRGGRRDTGPVRDWEEELRELFGERRDEESQPGQDGVPEDRPWLEVEPIPPVAEDGPLLPEEAPFEVERQPERESDSAWPPARPATPEAEWKEVSVGPRPSQVGEADTPVAGEVVTGEPAARPWVIEHRQDSFGDEPGWEEGEVRIGLPRSPDRRVRQVFMRDRQSVRMAVIMREILDRPRALRPYSPPRSGHGVS